MSSPYLDKPKRTLAKVMAERKIETGMTAANRWIAYRMPFPSDGKLGRAMTEQGAIADLLRKERGITLADLDLPLRAFDRGAYGDYDGECRVILDNGLNRRIAVVLHDDDAVTDLFVKAVNEHDALLKCEAALRAYLQAKDNVDGFSADKLLLCRTALAELEKVRQG